MRLLLIEDDAALRLGLAQQLQADGYRVDHAVDGVDGLFQAQEYPVDLVIVDLGLPRLSGIAVVQRLRGDDSSPAAVRLDPARSPHYSGVYSVEELHASPPAVARP